ncbi:MAG TPA: hypothetical protein GX747_00905 [Tenericutes bacterium]|nr:hypothetical protein [Mycoplasmatota bacterium]
MAFIKKHKLIIIFSTVFLILLISAFFGLFNLLYPNYSKDKYGDRLKGNEEYKLEKDMMNKIIASLKESDNVLDIKYDMSGKIINFIITINPNLELDIAKSLGNKLIELLDDKYETFYDIQLFLNTNEESELYPAIGYKHKDALSFSWSNVVIGGSNE